MTLAFVCILYLFTHWQRRSVFIWLTSTRMWTYESNRWIVKVNLRYYNFHLLLMRWLSNQILAEKIYRDIFGSIQLSKGKKINWIKSHNIFVSCIEYLTVIIVWRCCVFYNVLKNLTKIVCLFFFFFPLIISTVS